MIMQRKVPPRGGMHAMPLMSVAVSPSSSRIGDGTFRTRSGSVVLLTGSCACAAPAQRKTQTTDRRRRVHILQPLVATGIVELLRVGDAALGCIIWGPREQHRYRGQGSSDRRGADRLAAAHPQRAC